MSTILADCPSCDMHCSGSLSGRTRANCSLSLFWRSKHSAKLRMVWTVQHALHWKRNNYMPYVGIYDWLKREMRWALRTTLSVILAVFCFTIHTEIKLYFEEWILINDEGNREEWRLYDSHVRSWFFKLWCAYHCWYTSHFYWWTASINIEIKK